MPHRYTGSDERVYPNAQIGGLVRPLHAEPGMPDVEFDEPPADGRWEPVQETKSAPAKKAPAAAETAEE